MSIFFCVIVVTSCSSMKNVGIRPLSIKVLDSKTKKPMKGVVVYYMLKTINVNDRIFIVFRNPELKYKDIIKEIKIFYTDKNGIITVDNVRINMSKKDLYLEEMIFINVDIKLKDSNVPDIIKAIKFWKAGRYLIDYHTFFNPLNNNIGKCIFTSSTWYLNPEMYGGTMRAKYDIIYNSKGLQKEKEYFVIYLERITPQRKEKYMKFLENEKKKYDDYGRDVYNKLIEEVNKKKNQ